MLDEKRKKRLLWQLPFLALLIVGTVYVIRQQQSMPYQHSEGMVFGTFYKVTYQSDTDLSAAIEEGLSAIDRSLSPFNASSVITAVNENRPVTVDEHFSNVFQLAMTVSEATGGAFDITVAPLVNAWGFGFKSGTPPTRHDIDSLLHLIGYKNVRLEGGRVVKADPRILLDCSAIAKGYGTDHIARLLKKRGVTNFMVEIGGEVVTRGISPKRLPWKIGVTKPVDDSLSSSQELQTVLNVTDKAMATSGNYRNFYYRDGKKYAHTIDPKTGYPVQHSLLSATVLAPDCATADAYATAFMVMGMARAKEVLSAHEELSAYFIYANDDGSTAVWYSPTLKGKIAE